MEKKPWEKFCMCLGLAKVKINLIEWMNFIKTKLLLRIPWEFMG